MDPKTALTNGVFCPMPWTGLMFNADGTVRTCQRSAGSIGNLRHNTIQEILADKVNLHTQSEMLSNRPGPDCSPCYDIEQGKKRFDIVSDRKFYIRELRSVPFDTYQQGNHDLRAIDVRWSNLCNFACVYCGPEYSSRWASELDSEQPSPSESQRQQFRSYIMDHAHQLQHVYLAGGEPLLMKENIGLLGLLLRNNPDVNLRVNTNLSRTNTPVFDMICQFKNVHWIISVETQHKQYEYIRWGGSWSDFNHNLDTVRTLDHKITFNMLYFLLNYKSIFDCVDYFEQLGFHANSFVISAMSTPLYLNVRHLPRSVLESLESLLQDRIDRAPGFLLEDSYRNLLHYIKQPFASDLTGSIQKLMQMDQRRGLDSKQIFADLYELL